MIRNPNKHRSLNFRKSLKVHFIKLPIEMDTKKHHQSKFSTSNFQQEANQQIQNIIEDQRNIQQGITLTSNLLTNCMQMRPNINSKIIDTIFQSQFKKQQKQSYQINVKSATSVFQVVDNIAQKTINDYIIEKIKKQIKKKKSEFYTEQVSINTFVKEYDHFMQEFNLENMKKFYKCLNNVKAIAIDKNYIVNNLYFYFKKKNFNVNQPQDILMFCEIKLKNEMIATVEDLIYKIRFEINQHQNKRQKIKQYMAKTKMHQHQKAHLSQQIEKINIQMGSLNSKLAKQQQKSKRLIKEKICLRQEIKRKIDNIISTGIYFPEGYSSIYNQIVEADIRLDEHLLSNLLDRDQIDFLNKKLKIESEYKFLNNRLRELEIHSASKMQIGKLKIELAKLKNELVIIQENILEKIKSGQDIEKHIFSLFGNGEAGKKMLKKVKGVESSTM